jgi:hypothetical protein
VGGRERKLTGKAHEAQEVEELLRRQQAEGAAAAAEVQRAAAGKDIMPAAPGGTKGPAASNIAKERSSAPAPSAARGGGRRGRGRQTK